MNLEPEDPIYVACTECGEEECIEHVNDAIWLCLICNDTFSDGSDYQEEH